MEELRQVTCSSYKNGPESPVICSVNGELIVPDKQIGEKEATRIWGGDRRLSLFGYTIETINMLLVPMINTK